MEICKTAHIWIWIIEYDSLQIHYDFTTFTIREIAKIIGKI